MADLESQAKVHFDQGATTLEIESGGFINFNGGAISGAAVVFSSVGAVTAAGSAQGSAAALPNATNVVSGADGTKGVILPVPTAVGQEVTILNTNAVSALKVYADSGGTGGTINGGSANASVNLAASKGATYVCTSTTGASAWWSLSN